MRSHRLQICSTKTKIWLLGRARFASGGGAPNKDIGFPRGGVGLTPQEAEEGQTPQKLRLERGKEANDSQFPLESHFF